ncbi:tyrosine-type recombinase/integrase [Heliorestis convoluta]|nr:tyrosine-type recombinase/integrase [Heliorestis convoluta]
MNKLIEDYTEEALRSKSSTTVRTYQYELKQFEAWLFAAGTDLYSYARADVQQYIDSLMFAEKSASTVNKAFHALKSFSKWLGKEEAVEDIRVVKPVDYKKSAPKSLDRLDTLRLIRQADRSENARDYAIIMILLHTGIRVGELVALNRSDVVISERKGRLIIREGKGNKSREVPLNPETRRAIVKSLEERLDDNRALFISNRNSRITARTVQRIVKKYGGDHPHRLRHTFITALIRSGEDFSLAMALSGHSSADMIMRYSQPSEEEKQRAVDKLYLTRGS